MIKIQFEVRYDDTDELESAFTKEFENFAAMQQFIEAQNKHPFLYLTAVKVEEQ